MAGAPQSAGTLPKWILDELREKDAIKKREWEKKQAHLVANSAKDQKQKSKVSGYDYAPKVVSDDEDGHAKDDQRDLRKALGVGTKGSKWNDESDGNETDDGEAATAHRQAALMKVVKEVLVSILLNVSDEFIRSIARDAKYSNDVGATSAKRDRSALEDGEAVDLKKPSAKKLSLGYGSASSSSDEDD